MAAEFKVGDRVRVLKASHGWGDVKAGDVGVVVQVDYRDVRGQTCLRVDFPTHPFWMGRLECFELEKPARKKRFKGDPMSIDLGNLFYEKERGDEQWDPKKWAPGDLDDRAFLKGDGMLIGR